jgi:hypothetical protein
MRDMGAVAGLNSQATRLVRDAISFERTMARGAQTEAPVD